LYSLSCVLVKALKYGLTLNHDFRVRDLYLISVKKSKKLHTQF